MAELPKIAGERLRAQAVAAEHPDANLLSSFAEQALTEQERAPVLEHLSRCAQCREIVSLSTAEAEPEMQVVAARTREISRRSWWRSPVVHWSVLTAAALVVLIAAGERMRLHDGRTASAPAIRYEPPVAQSTSPPAPQAAALPESSKPSKQVQATTTAPAVLTQPTRRAQATAPVVASQFDYFNARDAITPKSTPDQMAIGGAVIGRAAGMSAPAPVAPAALPITPLQSGEAGKVDGPLIESGNFQAEATPASSASETVTVEGAAPVVSSSQRDHALFSGARAIGKTIVALPRWSISGAGVVQRSLDAGKSWKEVAVAGGVIFRAISAAGNGVWAGGSGGALFHSADSGEHWSRVQVQTGDRSLSGDILIIDFADGAHGAISTSTGETWKTLDTGATWQLQ